MFKIILKSILQQQLFGACNFSLKNYTAGLFIIDFAINKCFASVVYVYYLLKHCFI